MPTWSNLPHAAGRKHFPAQVTEDQARKLVDVLSRVNTDIQSLKNLLEDKNWEGFIKKLDVSFIREILREHGLPSRLPEKTSLLMGACRPSRLCISVPILL